MTNDGLFQNLKEVSAPPCMYTDQKVSIQLTMSWNNTVNLFDRGQQCNRGKVI